MPDRPYITAKIKKEVAKRARFLCEYCKCPQAYAPGPFGIEHIIPISQNGNSDLMNLTFACNGCNGYKYNKIKGLDIVSDTMVSLYHPRMDKWSDHFKWSSNNLLILGFTAKGRATIDLLKLNREELLNIRGLLQLIGEHPPIN